MTKIYCAIDTPDVARATELARQVSSAGCGVKLGLEFFSNNGPAGVSAISKACPDAKIFLDMKYHDIPNTVAGAVRAVTHILKPHFITLHASGGIEMMRAAKEACYEGTKILAVTVLTSFSKEDLVRAGVHYDTETQVQGLTEVALQAKMDGIVCSPLEVDLLRSCFGPSLILMVPGIRPAGADVGDQKRVMTPREALDAGATHLVIGRPITGAKDPAQAAADILATLE